ncbi:MAG: hypothetical protein HIU82_14170 [Proteobacteria bacterium]|nr:hypothetical protein [Pseudomonadota bacterium]
MPDFMMFYRRGRTGREFEQIVEGRTRQVALKDIRRFVVANLRRGYRVKVVAIDEVVEIPPVPPPPEVGILRERCALRESAA